MAKQSWKPGNMIFPLPAVLVTCGDSQHSNMLTVAWTGTLCTNPPMCYIAVRPERHSYGIIKANMEFTINLTTAQMAHATDWAGVRSGSEYDKWEETGLTSEPGVTVECPSIKESPVNIECRVKEILPLGSHHLFIADVVNVLADESLLDADTGAFDLGRAGLMSYTHGHYYRQGEEIGRFGFSVKKDSSRKKTTKKKSEN